MGDPEAQRVARGEREGDQNRVLTLPLVLIIASAWLIKSTENSAKRREGRGNMPYVCGYAQISERLNQ